MTTMRTSEGIRVRGASRSRILEKRRAEVAERWHNSVLLYEEGEGRRKEERKCEGMKSPRSPVEHLANVAAGDAGGETDAERQIREAWGA